MDFFFFVFIAFTIFVCCSLCGFCCRNKESGAIYSTPVVITSETHQVPGQIYAQQTTISPVPNMSSPYAGTTYPINNAAPYPPAQPYAPGNTGSPYPPAQPYAPNAGSQYPPSQYTAPYPPESSAPYPPQPAAPYPSQPSAPYPSYPQQGMVNPPTYNEAVTMEAPGYQKPAPFNPSYPQN